MSKQSPIEQLSSARRRLRELREEAAGPADPQRFASDLGDLEAQVAGLEVAYEVLEQQNDELLATREELERQRHRYLELFHEAPFGYLVTDLGGVVEEANRAAAGMLGFAQELMAHMPFTMLLAKEDEARFRAFLSRIRSGGEAGEIELRLRRRSQETFPAVLTAVRDQDRQPRLRWAVRDVSRAKAAEEALRESEERLRHSQRMESVGRLAGGIAHSFNNLLAAIAFQCEILGEKLAEGDERRSHVEEIQRAGERAASLSRQLLTFGRRQVIQPRRLPLNGLLHEMEPMLQRLIGENIRLEVRTTQGCCDIHADLGQIEQVILNLVANARDAMPDGGSLLLATEETEILGDGSELPPGRYVQLTVADTGTGIAPRIMEHLFEPFHTTKERGRGTGLGLATVHGIVHQSGGRIAAESEPGRGSRFTILLRRAEGEEEAPQPSPSERRAVPRSDEVVLLVEDEDNIRQPAAEILESRGYRVLAAADASEALTVAEKHRDTIHILVTDVIMPGLNGNQLAEKLTKSRPEMRVLYISGYPEDSIAHHGVLHPEQHFLQKPFAPGRFLEKVREVLDLRPARPVGGMDAA